MSMTSNSYHANDLNHLLKFTVLVVIAFTKKEKSHTSTKGRAVGRANKQPFSEYFSDRTGFIFILCLVYMLSYGESKSPTSYMLLNINMMSTSNFEYE